MISILKKVKRWQKKNKWHLIGSAATLEDIRNGIVKFFAGSTVTLNQTTDNEWSVSTLKGLVKNTKVSLIKGRYRFEMLQT